MRVGVNFWQAMWLGAPGPLGDRARLARELDRLGAAGVSDLRIMAAAEGPNDAPERVVPALQPEPGVWDEALVEGLETALGEIGSRGMRAIVCLGNFWFWSGGLAQYRAWAGSGHIPYPGGTGDWEGYERFAAGFYRDAGARALFDAHVDRIVSRCGGADAITAWEICNEPRGKGDASGMRAYLVETAERIAALDPGCRVASGSEGATADPAGAGLGFSDDHAHPSITVTTCHLWPQNWGLWDPVRGDADALDRVIDWARGYIREHAERAASLGKPLLVEELGLARDGGAFGPAATTRHRDRFLSAVLGECARLEAEGLPIESVLPWAWSGEAVPPRPGEWWRPGDPYGGDPPHEPQGWYGILASDATTLEVLESAARGPG